MPVRSEGRVQTKRDTLVLQDGGWAWGYQPHPVKNNFVPKRNTKWRLVVEEAKAHPGLQPGQLAGRQAGTLFHANISFLDITCYFYVD
jgi:hypothetical protein